MKAELGAKGLGARGVIHLPANSVFVLPARGQRSPVYQKGCFAGARELRSGRDKGTKLRSAVEITIYHQAGNQSKNAYMTAISGSSCRIQSSSPCPTASVPKKQKDGSSSK
jgi:hypothetical protein